MMDADIELVVFLLPASKGGSYYNNRGCLWNARQLTIANAQPGTRVRWNMNRACGSKGCPRWPMHGNLEVTLMLTFLAGIPQNVDKTSTKPG